MSESSQFDPLTQALSGATSIEASAGTGKTYSITLLWLRLLIAGKSIRQSRYVLQALGVNSTFLARRGGSKFFRSEKVLHRLFQQTTTFSTVKLWVRLIARLSYRLGPSLLRKAHRGIKTEKFFTMKPLELFGYLRNDPLDIQADLK